MRLGDDFSRVVILGDVHGRADLLRQALAATSLYDNGLWTGGRTLLLQAGDLIDRGPRGLECMDLFMSLSDQARQAGGLAVSVLGNHELMALSSASGDPMARAMWSRNGCQALFSEYRERCRLRGEAAEPESFYEMFSPSGPYGQWMLGRPALVKTPEFILTHAGLTLEAEWERLLAEIDETLEALPDTGYRLTELRDPLFGRDGPFWTRQLDPQAVEAVCRREGVKFQVIGHTPGFGASGRVLNVDAGMVYFGIWRAAAWEDGRWWVYGEGSEPSPLGWD